MAKKEETEGGLPEIRVRCTVSGLKPFLQNRFIIPKEGDKPTKVREDVPLEQMMYCDENGIYFPTDNFRMMILGNQKRPGAAQIYGSYIVGGKKGKEYRTLAKACLWVRGLSGEDNIYVAPPRKTYDAFDERSYVMKTGRKVIRRPMVNLPWSFTFRLHIFGKSLTEPLVRAFYDVAGIHCGIGDYGPEFGAFKIADWISEK